MKTVMYMYFVKLIFVGQRAPGDVDMVSGLIFHREYHRMARVAYQSIYLRAINALMQ